MRLTADQAHGEGRLSKRQAAENSFMRYMAHHGITGYDRQTRFAPPRRWQADFCWLREKLIVEIEGITYFGLKQGRPIGRHQTPEGFEKDCEKYLAATLLGYLVLRFPHTWVIKDRREVWDVRMAEAIKQLLALRAQEGS